MTELNIRSGTDGADFGIKKATEELTASQRQTVRFSSPTEGSPTKSSTKSLSPDKRQATKAAHSLASAFERHVAHSEQQLDRELQSAINDIRRNDAVANRVAAQAALRSQRHQHNEERLGKASLRHHAQANERIAHTEAKLAMKEDRYLRHVGASPHLPSEDHSPNALLITQTTMNSSVNKELSSPKSSPTKSKSKEIASPNRLPPLIHTSSHTDGLNGSSPTNNRDPVVLKAIKQRLPEGRRLHCVTERAEGRKVEALTRQNMARQVKDKERTAKGPSLLELLGGKVVPMGYGSSGGRGISGTGEGVSVIRKTSPQRNYGKEGAPLDQRPGSRSIQEGDERRQAVRALLLPNIPSHSNPIRSPIGSCPQSDLKQKEETKDNVSAILPPAETLLQPPSTTDTERRYSASSSYTTVSQEVDNKEKEKNLDVGGLLAEEPLPSTKIVNKYESQLRFFDEEERFSNDYGGSDDNFEASSSSSEGSVKDANRSINASNEVADPSIEKSVVEISRSSKRKSSVGKSPSPHRTTKITTGVLPKRGLPMYGQKSLVPIPQSDASSNKRNSNKGTAAFALPSLRRVSPAKVQEASQASTGKKASPLLDPVPVIPRRLEALKVHAGGGKLKLLLPPSQRTSQDNSALAETYTSQTPSPVEKRIKSLSPTERLPIRNTNPATMAHTWMTKTVARTTRIRARIESAILPDEDHHLEEAKKGALLWLHTHPNVISSTSLALQTIPSPKKKVVDPSLEKKAVGSNSDKENEAYKREAVAVVPQVAIPQEQPVSEVRPVEDSEDNVVQTSFGVGLSVMVISSCIDKVTFHPSRDKAILRIQQWWKALLARAMVFKQANARQNLFDVIVANEAAEAITRFFRSIVIPKIKKEKRRAIARSAVWNAVKAGNEIHQKFSVEESSDFTPSPPSSQSQSRPDRVAAAAIDGALKLRLNDHQPDNQ